MNEKRLDEEMIAYLYGEASEEEAQAFERHLSACVTCRDELAAFGHVRQAVGAWRMEALGALGSPLGVRATPETAVAADESAAARMPGRRSALLALREFFTLSPLWLRAGTATAALVICALAALALLNAELRWDAQGGVAFSTGLSRPQSAAAPTQGVPAPTAETAPRRYSEEEVEQIVAERVRRELEALREPPGDRSATLAVNDSSGGTDSSAPERTPRRRVVPTSGGAQSRDRQILRAEGRRGTDDIPRLYDLLGEGE